MKKLFFTLAILAGFAIQALAYDFCVDGIYYNGGYFPGDPYVIVTFGSGYGCYEGDVVIPETVTYEGLTYAVTEIGPDAFRDCVGLISVTIPTSVIHIDARAFYGCTALQDIHIPDWMQRIHATAFDNTVWYNEQLDNQPLYLDGWCMGYKGEMPLVELNIEEGTIAVADGAFAENESLISVTLPNTLVHLGYFVFEYCSYLRYVDFGESIEEIMYKAFDECRSLDSVVLPETVSQIGRYAFSNCVSLSYLILPRSLTFIGAYAFDECISLNTVICLGSTPAILDQNNVFEVPNNAQLIVPCGSADAYSNSNWGEVFTNITEDCSFAGAEWYYEIQNEGGTITYQHLEYAADTTVNDKTVQIIIRTNTLYDKNEYAELTREYVYQEDDMVYWWNKDLQEFTVLYDLGAQEGDSWVIKVGTEFLTMHVDAVDQYEYEGRLFKLLQVSDAEDLFSGIIVCGIGHLTSFFPERLMTRGKGYRVEGIRCYWRNGELFFKYGDRDCDEIYGQYHDGIEEDGPSTGSGTLLVYPNPTNGVLFVETQNFASLPTQTYRITNLMGQTLMTGTITAETQQIDVSALPQGMYFISVGEGTQKFVVN